MASEDVQIGKPIGQVVAVGRLDDSQNTDMSKTRIARFIELTNKVSISTNTSRFASNLTNGPLAKIGLGAAGGALAEVITKTAMVLGIGAISSAAVPVVLASYAGYKLTRSGAKIANQTQKIHRKLKETAIKRQKSNPDRSVGECMLDVIKDEPFYAAMFVVGSVLAAKSVADDSQDLEDNSKDLIDKLFENPENITDVLESAGIGGIVGSLPSLIAAAKEMIVTAGTTFTEDTADHKSEEILDHQLKDQATLNELQEKHLADAQSDSSFGVDDGAIYIDTTADVKNGMIMAALNLDGQELNEEEYFTFSKDDINESSPEIIEALERVEVRGKALDAAVRCTKSAGKAQTEKGFLMVYGGHTLLVTGDTDNRQSIRAQLIPDFKIEQHNDKPVMQDPRVSTRIQAVMRTASAKPAKNSSHAMA